MNRNRRTRSLLVAAALSLLGACASQPGLTSSEIDKLAASAMSEFQVPGVVIGVVKDGQVAHAAGYGVREFGQPGPVDTQTLFRIASMTKAMWTPKTIRAVSQKDFERDRSHFRAYGLGWRLADVQGYKQRG